MEWIWLLFVLFSVLGGLLERLEKAKKKWAEPEPASPPSPPPNEGRFFLDEPEVKKKPVRPRERPGLEVRPPDLAGAPAGRRPAESTDFAGEDLIPAFWEEEPIPGPEKEWAAGPGETGEFWETHQAEPGKIRPKLTPLKESRDEPLPEGGWQGLEAFLPALVLAEVLRRPDFKSFPWQRRL